MFSIYHKALLSLVIFFLLTACANSQQYDQCDMPKDSLKILFKPENPAHPFSHSFCVVCNTEIEPEEYEDWALDMGAPEGPSSVDDVHPCLYVYSSGNVINNLEMCQSLVCDGGATYNDMVGKNNSNIDVTPILQ